MRVRYGGKAALPATTAFMGKHIVHTVVARPGFQEGESYLRNSCRTTTITTVTQENGMAESYFIHVSICLFIYLVYIDRVCIVINMVQAEHILQRGDFRSFRRHFFLFDA